MTDRELHNIFERQGINKIDPKGEAFNHNFHQAMFETETKDTDGTIIQVLQVGYKIKNRLLRPAMVGVSKGTPEGSPKEGDKKEGDKNEASFHHFLISSYYGCLAYTSSIFLIIIPLSNSSVRSILSPRVYFLSGSKIMI